MTYDSDGAAEYLKCSVSRISELVRSGQLRAAQVGRGYVFRPEWLDEYLEAEADRLAAERQAIEFAPPPPQSPQEPTVSRRGGRYRPAPSLDHYFDANGEVRR